MIGAILLAAGGSQRMGRPKQLLPYQGEALVRRAARMLLVADYTPVCVVVGAHRLDVIRALGDLDVSICIHPDWTRGIGSSLRAGIVHLEHVAPDTSGAIVALADQPHVSPEFLSSLRSAFSSDAPIVAASYIRDDTVGVPALFGRALFPQLRDLPDDQGAQALIREHPADCITVPLAESDDVDNPADYARLIASERCQPPASPLPYFIE